MTNLPDFSTLDATKYVEQLQQMLTTHRLKINQLLEEKCDWNWQNLMLPLEELDDKLDQFWGPLAHLHAVKNSAAIRQAYQECLPLLSDYYTELGQNQVLFHAVKSLTKDTKKTELKHTQRKIIQDTLRDFHLAGVDLSTDKKARYKEINQRLSELATTFSNNVLDATNAWTVTIENTEQLAGLPKRALTIAKEAAEQQNKAGYLLTLDYPCFDAVITYADNRELREMLYTAYTTKASDQGPHAGKWDNSAIMDEIIRLRAEMAQLLDFNNYTDYSLTRKMATSSQAVTDFLTDLVKRIHQQAEQEYKQLCAFAHEQYGIEKLEPWDIPYFTEKLREAEYAFSEETLRAYFPIDTVLNGLFSIIKKLYAISFVERTDVDTWHEEVRFFDLVDESGNQRGSIYMDLYARRDKRGGAWMDECITHRRCADGSLQLPVAYLNGNFSPNSGGNPALLSHEEVLTLFHECGHCLHHLLTRVEYGAASGINGVPWDAVELPSQFFEHWCWQRDSLDLMAKHYQTSELIPEKLFNKMLRAKHFQSALRLIRQLEFATFDWRLHEHTTNQDMNIQALLDQVRQEIAILPTATFNRFQHSFSHIFSGGYAAGYYSYLWAEVLACDAFSKFEETGILNSQTGHEFKTHILEQGGSDDPLKLFADFRGREPTNQAFLRLNGIWD